MGDACPVSRSEATGSRALPRTPRCCGSAGFCLDVMSSLLLTPRCPEQVPDNGLREGVRNSAGSTAGRPAEGGVSPGQAASNWEQVYLSPHTGRSHPAASEALVEQSSPAPKLGSSAQWRGMDCFSAAARPAGGAWSRQGHSGAYGQGAKPGHPGQKPGLCHRLAVWPGASLVTSFVRC